MLSAAANVSRLLFPSSRARPAIERAERLRAALNLDDTSLITSRAARNYLEHFDERLDKYLFGQHGILVDQLIVERWEPNMELDDGTRLPAAGMRVLEMSTCTFILFDEHVPLKPLAEELERIHTSAKARLTEL